MSSTVTIIIANRCIVEEKLSLLTLKTRTAKSKLFFIPTSQVRVKKKSHIEYNDQHKEPATEYVLTKWIFGKKKEYFDKMHINDLRIVE